MKHLLEQLVKELLTSQRGDAPSAGPTDIPAEYGPAETAYCEGLSRKLLLRLEARIRGHVTKADFMNSNRAWAESLCETPGGLDLVQMVGNTWRRRARKHGGGVTAFVQGIKDWKNGVSESASILYRAIQCSNLAGQMSKDAKKDKQVRAAGLTNKVTKRTIYI